MTRRFTLGPVTDVRAVADKVEQLALELRRTVAAIEGIVDDVKVVYQMVSLVIAWVQGGSAPSRPGSGSGVKEE